MHARQLALDELAHPLARAAREALLLAPADEPEAQAHERVADSLERRQRRRRWR